MIVSPENILSDLIRINSVNPPGNETSVALYLKKHFDDSGIKSEIIEPEEGRGSFIARIGSGEKKLLYISHTDVVPVGEGWDFDPFSGLIKNGVIHGRGALDCKDLVAAQAAAVLQLHSEGVPLNGELIFAATADEEMGGSLGVEYIMQHSPEKLMADYAVNEGAVQPISQDGKMIYFFQVGEKGITWCNLKAKGIAGHGSIPTLADNAVVKLARAVSLLADYRPKIVLIPEVEKLLKELALLCDIGQFSVEPSEIDQLLAQLPLHSAFVENLRAITRMTVSPNVIKGGNKTNIVPDFCEIEVDIRIMPGQDCDYVASELRSIIGDEIEIDFIKYSPPTFTSSEEPFFKLMETITSDLAGPEVLCLPVVSTGSTDSKFLRVAGIPSFGIGHMDRRFDKEASTTIHGKNERTDIASLHLKTAFLKELARQYLR
ncbi:MAG TPA: M20/M25/M40 family metallo-hydrolase [Candidatus Limnocylindrales bacterium]|nr:M20/M25/M40 family metallo-hydrolase [Candidatus Limnocylindrales bacterium]